MAASAVEPQLALVEEDEDMESGLTFGSGRSQARPQDRPQGRAKIPLHSDMKRMISELRGQDFAGTEPDSDEYDIPTFLRKHAD
jgi:hypothetical protein